MSPPPVVLTISNWQNERHICSCCFGTTGDIEEYQMKRHTLHPKTFSKSIRASDLEEFYHFIKEEQLKWGHHRKEADSLLFASMVETRALSYWLLADTRLPILTSGTHQRLFSFFLTTQRMVLGAGQKEIDCSNIKCKAQEKVREQKVFISCIEIGSIWAAGLLIWEGR